VPHAVLPNATPEREPLAGPAVNMASRLETLTKQLGRTVLLSRAFADFVESDFDLEPVGEYPVRGFNEPIELFAYHG
jgi:adenylate cyclase